MQFVENFPRKWVLSSLVGESYEHTHRIWKNYKFSFRHLFYDGDRRQQDRWRIDGRSYGLTPKKLQENVSQWFIVVSGVLSNISKVHQILITENVKISRWPPPVFFWQIKKKICQIWLYSFMFGMKVIRNVILNNIDIYDHWSTFQDASFSLQESPKFSRFEKYKDYSYFQWHWICFGRNKNCQKLRYKQL